MENEVDDVALISIDSKGTDIRVRQGAQVRCLAAAIVLYCVHPNSSTSELTNYSFSLQFNIQRIPFEDGHAVETLEEAKAALWQLINRGRVHNLQK